MLLDSEVHKHILFCLLQEECLQRLQDRIEVQYDSTNIDHQVLVLAVINAALL
jgi:hypothetical protein